MIDIHSHILPGLDDGAENLEEAILMAEAAVQSGTRAMACSVHSNQLGRYENFETQALQDSYRQLVQALKQEKIPLVLVRGMEIFSSGDLTERIREGELISLNRSGNYLVEFPFPESPMVIGELIADMLKAGLQPVIAHPERYYCVQDDPNYLYEWISMGALAQLNKGSVFGRFGRGPARAAEVMLENRLVQCVASDAHGIRVRTPDMSDIRDYLNRNWTEDYARRLLEVNPSRILMGQPVIGREEARAVEYPRFY